MMSSFAFGKHLFSAINFYKTGNYTDANFMIDKALLINKSDFTANFWKMRITIMQRKYEEAINLINELKYTDKLIDLIIPWKEFCLNQIHQTNDKNIDILNDETNDLLEYFQHHRVFCFLDIIYAVFPVLVLAIMIIPFKLSVNMSGIVMGLIYTPLILVLFYNKAILIPNIYISMHYGINKFRQLVTKKIFIQYFFFMAIMIASFRKSIDIAYNDIVIFVISDFFYPVFEEIFFRGFLYGYLQKYGKLLSWFMVTIAFYVLHIELANSWHIILSIMCLYIYDQEKTIIAPIFVHVVNNLLSSFFVLIR